MNGMRSERESLIQDVPEFKDAPCNICGRGWPYHVDTCAYKATAQALADARSALRYIEERYGRLDGVGWERVLDA